MWGSAVNSSDIYRRFAAECVQLAKQIHDPSRKATLLAMAASWEKLAEWIDSPAILALKAKSKDGDQT